MLAPMLVQMERQIDREIAADNKANAIATQTEIDTQTQSVSIGTEMEEEFDSDSEEEEDVDGPTLMYGPQPQIVTNDLKSLDEMVSYSIISRVIQLNICAVTSDSFIAFIVLWVIKKSQRFLFKTIKKKNIFL